jgi:NCAIR mutase (PurE)-related protein
MVLKLLGLDTLICSVDLSVELLRKENEELKNQVKDLLMAQEGLKAGLDEVTEKVDGMEEFDSSQFVSEEDINDRIESYLNDNDYVTSSYVDDEIESKVSDAVESAIEDLDIDEKVRDLFNDASPAPMSEQEIKDEIREAVKVTLEKVIKALADQQG